MPLVWIRDDAEEAIYQQSLADPDRLFVVHENSSEMTYYYAGIKEASMKKLKTEKTKGKPFKPDSTEIIFWNSKKQLSFDFMYPTSLHWLEVKPFQPNLSFLDKQISFDF